MSNSSNNIIIILPAFFLIVVTSIYGGYIMSSDKNKGQQQEQDIPPGGIGPLNYDITKQYEEALYDPNKSWTDTDSYESNNIVSESSPEKFSFGIDEYKNDINKSDKSMWEIPKTSGGDKINKLKRKKTKRKKTKQRKTKRKKTKQRKSKKNQNKYTKI